MSAAAPSTARPPGHRNCGACHPGSARTRRFDGPHHVKALLSSRASLLLVRSVMNRHWIRVWGTSSAAFACVLVGTPPRATADDAANSEKSQPVLTDSRLGGVRLNAFAAMVDEPESVVLQRLGTAPELVPLALAAGEMRLHRKRSGKVMAITGFSILGVGAIGGLALFVSSISDSCSNDGCGESGDGRAHLGLLVGAVSVGVGLALGIPGIVRMASQSSLEEEAVARYRSAISSSLPSRGVASVNSTRSQSSPGIVTWPLVSFAF